MCRLWHPQIFYDPLRIEYSCHHIMCMEREKERDRDTEGGGFGLMILRLCESWDWKRGGRSLGSRGELTGWPPVSLLPDLTARKGWCCSLTAKANNSPWLSLKAVRRTKFFFSQRFRFWFKFFHLDSNLHGGDPLTSERGCFISYPMKINLTCKCSHGNTQGLMLDHLWELLVFTHQSSTLDVATQNLGLQHCIQGFRSIWGHTVTQSHDLMWFILLKLKVRPIVQDD